MSETNIYDVAGAAGVSLATVSRVLNHPEKVKKETRDLVLKVIKAKGYVPNQNARNLASRKNKCIALIVPTLRRTAFTEIAQGAYDASSETGYGIKLFVKPITLEAKDYWADVLSSGIDGIVFVGNLHDPKISEMISSSPFPMGFINTNIQRENSFNISTDFIKVGYDAVSFVHSHGSKGIAFVGSKVIQNSRMDEMFLVGYKKAMKEYGLKEYIFDIESESLEESERIKDFLKKNTKIDCAICIRDHIGIMFMNTAINLGYKVPEQFEVFALHGTRYAQLSNPSLSVAELPLYEAGHTAIIKMKELLEANDENPCDLSDIILMTSYAKRGSTRK